MNHRTCYCSVFIFLGLALGSAHGATTVEIEATRAFHMNSGTNPDAGTRMLAGGWPDNAGWGFMRGMMAFDLSKVPQDAAGIASVSLSIFTRKTGFSVTNPEGSPGDMAIKDVGNQETNADFDRETATWADFAPPGGDVSGPVLSTFARADYKPDWPHGTEVLFPTSDAFSQAVTRALADGQEFLYLTVYCPDFEANPVDGKHFYRLGGGEGLPVLHVTALGADSDSDGLEDEWELGFFPGDLAALSSNGDADEDGLNDKGEFLAGSDPTNPDSDGDTISDGAEVVSWRSDPTKTDSDGDGLVDNEEIAENPFITNPANADTDDDGLNDGDEVTAGTDPSNPDTDGDSYEDGLEKTFGADPADAASVTGSLVRGGQWKVEMAIADGQLASAEEINDLLDNGDGLVSEIQTTEWDVINFQVTTSVDAFFDTLTTYPILENPVAQPIGMRVSGGIFVRETGLVTLGYDSHAALGSLFIDGQEVELVEGAAHNTGRRPHFASIELEAGPHDLVLYHWPARDTGVYMFSSLQNGEQETYDSSVMELLPAFDIANVMTEDSDGDGLDDFWENFYFGDLSRDGSGDQDGDGLSDALESENRANPTKKDTDGDGLEDGAEVADHQTAPYLFDTDGDAIGDGDEVTQHETDPNKRDTDDDGIADNIEITLGSTPTDPASIPDIVVLQRDQATGRSWLDGSFWSDGESVTAGKDYQVGGVPGLGGTVRSPASQDPVFAGEALALEEGSTLRLKHFGTAVLPDTTAKNATIEQGQANQVIGLAADIAVDENLRINIQGENRRLNLTGHLSGTGQLVLTGVLGGELAVDSPIGGFAGEILIEDITVINEAPGSLGRSDVDLSGALWSNAALNFAGKRLTLIGTEVGLQLDHDIYVKELYFKPDREAEAEFDLDGLLGDPKGTAIGAEWFENPDLGSLEELVQSTDGDPQGKIIFSDDADGDGLPDVWELDHGLDPAVDDREGDSDEDGLGNELEFYLGTDLANTDSDGDGLTDGDEFTVHGSSPSSTDSDGDGLPDGAEVNEHQTSPALADSDADGVGDADELNVHQTDPGQADTDCDGVSDGMEIANGTDPLDAASKIGLWEVRTVESNRSLSSLAIAEEVLAGDGLTRELVTYHPTINFLGTGGGGNYAEDSIFPHMTAEGQDLNDFAILVTGSIQIDTAGIYTLGFNTDDGGQLQVDGTVVAEFPGTRGVGDSLGSIELSEGEHEVRFVMFERGGGSAAELFMATETGELDTFSENGFQLVSAVSGPLPEGCGDGGGDGDLATGLQGYWSFDEGGGTSAVDSSGNAGDAVVLSGQPGWTDGQFGKATDLDGASSFHVPDFYGVGGNSPRTISMWIRTDWEVPDGSTGLVGFGVSANEQKWHFKIETSTKGLRTENQGGNNFGEIVVNDGQWHHVVSVFPEGGEVIGDVIHYVDGVPDAAKNGGLTRPVNTETNPDNGARTFSIGSAFQGETERFSQAIIDEVALWDRALSPDEIAQLGQSSLLEILDLPPVPPVDPPEGGDDLGLTEVVWTANGLAFELPPGEAFDIDYSTDLENWEVIASGVTGSFEETDAARMEAPEGYYRARRP